MSFRAKCPNCGRKQTLEESDIGHTVWCSACGNRFVVEWAAPEPETASSLIPDIDFPASFASTGYPALPRPPVPPPVPTPPVHFSLTQQPLIAPGFDPAFDPHIEFVEPEPIVTAPAKNPLVPILISLVVILGLAVVSGIFTIAYLLNRPPSPMAHARTSVTPTINPTTANHPVYPSKPDDNPSTSTRYLPVVAVPATLPVVAQPRHESEDENVRRTTTPRVVATPDQSPPVFRPVRAAIAAPDLDGQIGKSIDRGVNFLLQQFVDGKLRGVDSSNAGPGEDALAVYALLQAGEATHDLRLNSNSAVVDKMLDALKDISMDHTDAATYSHSLRAAALGVYHRAADTKALRAEAAWLMADSSNGAYSYGPPPPGRSGNRQPFRFSGPWDNSNSQYGALGVWAALEAGVEIPNSYWLAVQKHWLSCQLPDGEWAYTGYGDMGRMSMTVAGITTLLVAEDQLDARAVVSTLGHVPFAPALQHGLNWLESGDNSVKLPANWRTYALYGVERAGLASGFKYFGTHDWYRQLATEQMGQQENDGSWTGTDPIVDTAYTLLFLSRGRHPIFMNKLRFDGFWANRPRDIANLTHYATTVLERPLNWQVVSLRSNWTDWMDSPVLFIASHEGVKFTDEDCDKLRKFANNGGLIFTHADGDAPAFNKTIADLSRRLFPQYPLTDLPSTHPIFSTLYKIKLQPKLQGISNGSRLLLLHSPTDLNKIWQQRDWVERPVDFQMGINIFIYAAGKADLNNKLKTPLVPNVDVTPIRTTSIAQLKYKGDYNPEPAGLPRFASLFLKDTSVKVDVVEADAASLEAGKISLAHLTGTGPVIFDTMQMKSIRDYVEKGGILLIDACGARQEFVNSMLLDFLPHTFPQSQMRDMPGDNPILAGAGAGMTPVSLRLRPYSSERFGLTQQPLQFFTLGKGMVVYSTVDLSTGFLGTNTWGVNGYLPSTTYDLTRNLLLSSLEKN